MGPTTTTRGHVARLLVVLVAMSALLAGCAEARQPSREIITDIGAGWELVYSGDALEAAEVGDSIRPTLSPLGSVSGWVHVWESGSSRVSVGLYYTGNEVANPLAGARRLRRAIEERNMVWTREFDDVAPAAVTLEVPTGSGVLRWVYGANRAYVFGIGFEGVSREFVGEVFAAQMATLPEFNPFDSIRPGVAATYLLGMVLALGYGVRVHRRRSVRLAGSRVEVFP